MLQLLLGQIPEAIYFALFIILTKSYKNKRILFIVLSIIEYILLLNLFPYSTWSHILYFALMYVMMKMLYKEKCQITDIFTLGIASIVLTLICGISYFIIWKTINNTIVFVILTRILLILFIILTRNKLHYIQDMYNKLWSRNNKIKKKINSIDTAVHICYNMNRNRYVLGAYEFWL